MDFLYGIDNFVKNLLKYKYKMSSHTPFTIGHTEYTHDYIGKYISDVRKLTDFTAGILPAKYGFRLGERAVEYPWFFSNLKDSEKTILDAGSVLNNEQILSAPKMLNRKIYICTLYYEGHTRTLPSPSYIYEDLRNLCFKDNFFDAICSLSTIEHIGLDNTKLYTPDEKMKENDKYAFLLAIRELKRVLKSGGTLYLSVPFGRFCCHGWLQVFDSELVNKLIDEFNPSKYAKTFFKYEDDQWNYSDEENCREAIYFDKHARKDFEKDYLAAARCVLCIELTK